MRKTDNLQKTIIWVVITPIILLFLSIWLTMQLCHYGKFENSSNNIKTTYCKIINVESGIGRLSSSYFYSAIAYINNNKTIINVSVSKRKKHSLLVLGHFYKVEYIGGFSCCAIIKLEKEKYSKKNVLEILHRKDSDFYYNENEKLRNVGPANYSILVNWFKKILGIYNDNYD